MKQGDFLSSSASGIFPELITSAVAGTSISVSHPYYTTKSYTLQEGETSHSFKVKVPKLIINPNCHNLPDEYQEVEYIQGTGTLYINTNYTITSNNLRTIMDMIFVSTGSSASLCGCENYITGTSGDRYFSNIIYSTSFNTYIGTGSIGSLSTGMISNQRMLLDYNSTEDFKCEVNINGTQVMSASWTGSTCRTRTYALWCNNTNGGCALTGANYKLYNFKLYDNNVLVRHMIPCYLKEVGAIGLYDIIENIFYPNNGSGTFLMGNLIRKYIREPYTITSTLNDVTSSFTFKVEEFKQYDIDARIKTTYDHGYVKTDVYTCGVSRGTSFNVLKTDAYIADKRPFHTGIRPLANMGTSWSANEPWSTPTDYYFVWYTFWCYAPAEYSKTVTMTSDDQGSVYLNDTFIGYRSTSLTLNFNLGWNKLEILYWEEGGGSYACFSGWNPSTDTNFSYVGPYKEIREEERIKRIWI